MSEAFGVGAVAVRCGAERSGAPLTGQVTIIAKPAKAGGAKL